MHSVYFRFRVIPPLSIRNRDGVRDSDRVRVRIGVE